MTLLVQASPLKLLEPLLQLASGFSSGVGVVVFLVVPVVLLGLSVVALLTARPGSLYWRWPVVWLLPTLAALVLLVLALDAPDSATSLSAWTWAGIVAFLCWATLMLLVGLPHLLVRFARFLFAAEWSGRDGSRVLRTVLYGWGSVAAGSFVLLCVALGRDVGAGWLASMGGLALLLGVASVRKNPLPSDDPRPATTARRLAWLAGALPLSLAGPLAPLLTVLAVFSEIEFGANNGTVALGFLWGVAVVGGVVTLVASGSGTRSEGEQRSVA